MASKAINAILNLRDNFSNTINKVTNNTKQFQRQVKLAEKQAESMRRGVAGAFSSTGMKIAGALGGIGLAVFAKESLELASNLNEVQNVVDTTFGDMANKINDFAMTTSSKFGMSELQAKKFSGTLGAMMKSSGVAGDELTKMSMDLTSLAGDFASFYNLEPEEAFEKIKAGMVGSSEPLLSLGINMQDAQLKAYALSKGIKTSWEQMKIGEKTMVRYQYLMEKSKDAQGDYAKTADSFANALRTLKLNVQTFGATIMSYAIPPLQSLFAKMNNFITQINVKDFMKSKVVPAFKLLGNVLTYIGGNMTWIIPIIASVASGFMAFMGIGKVISIIRGFSKTISSIGLLLNPITLLSGGIGLLIMGLITAYKNSSTFREKISGLLEKITGFGDYMGKNLPQLLDKANLFFIDKLAPALGSIGKVVEEDILPSLSNFVDGFIDLAKTIWDSVSPAWEWIKNNVIPDNFNGIRDAIKGTIDKATECINFIKDNWKEIEPIVMSIVGAIGAWKLALIAVNMWSGIVTITTALWSTIELIIWGVVNATSAWEAVQWLLNVALDANPIGAVIGIITLLGLAIYEVVTHWQEICDWCTKTWDILTNNPILMFIATIISPLGVALLGIIAHWKDICEWVEKAWNWLTSWNNTDAKNKEITVTKREENATDTFTPEGGNGNDPTLGFGYNATGTQYWSGGRTVVGEYGKEVVDLPSGSKVHTASESKKMMNGNGMGNINVIIQGNCIGNEEFANYVGQHVWDKVNLNLLNT